MKSRVLIIDDNDAVRATLRFLLSPHFDEVVAIENPYMIAGLPEHGKFDILLLDMNFDCGALDCSDGLFWLERMKSLQNPPAIVVITAFGDVDIAVKAMKLGAEDFITKPWDNDTLISKLKKAITANRKKLSEREASRRLSSLEDAERERMNLTLDEVKLRHIRAVIEVYGGNISVASQKLGINRQTLYNILKKKS